MKIARTISRLGRLASSARIIPIMNVDLLVLDDVFKAKATERIEELLFAVVDERGAWERPCLVSLNDTGDSLKERLSSDRGPALIRRFRDYCHQITF